MSVSFRFCYIIYFTSYFSKVGFRGLNVTVHCAVFFREFIEMTKEICWTYTNGTIVEQALLIEKTIV